MKKHWVSKKSFILIIMIFLACSIFISSTSATQYNVTNQSSNQDIDDLITNMSDNDILFFEEGLYQDKIIKSNKSNINLTAKKGKVLFNGSGSANNVNAIELNGNYINIINISISNYYDGINLNGNHNNVYNSDSSYNENGIWLEGDYNNVYNSTTSNNNNNGILVIGNYNKIYNSTSKNNLDGIWFVYNNNTVYDIISNDNQGNGIYFGGNDNSVYNSSFRNNGLGVTFSGNRNSIYNVISNDNYAGVSFEGNRAYVYNLTANNNVGDGLLITGNYNNISNVTANNNYFGIYLLGIFNNVYNSIANNNGNYGIHFTPGTNMDTGDGSEGDDFGDGGFFGGFLGDGSEGDDFGDGGFFGGLVDDESESGLSPTTNTYSNLYNSIAINNTFYGISSDGGNTTIYNSTATNNGFLGIYLFKDNNAIYNSTSEDNPIGILLEGNHNKIFASNILNNNIGVQIMGSNSSIVGNIIADNNVTMYFELWGNRIIDTNVNFNLIYNNSLNFDIGTDSSIGITNANYNWWGYDIIPYNYDIENISIDYYITNITITNKSNAFVGDDLLIQYYFVMNNNGVIVDLPNLVAKINNINTNNSNTNSYYLSGDSKDDISIPLDSLETKFSIIFCGKEFDNFTYITHYGTGKLNISNYSEIVGKTINITVNLTTENNNPLKNKNVSITINGTRYNSSTNNNGIATFSIDLVSSGIFEIVASYDEHEYNVPNVNSTLIVHATGNISINSPVIAIINDTITITTTFKSYNNVLLYNKTIILIINNVSHSEKTNIDGVATFTYLTNKTGILQITAKYNGTDYITSDVNKTLTVNKIATSMTLGNLTGIYSNNVNLQSTLKQNGFNLSNVTVIFYVDGIEVGRSVTNGSGVAVFSWKVNQVGNLKLEAVFNGTDFYLSSSNASLMSVSKGSTFVVVPNFSGVYGDNIELNATLKQNGFNLSNVTVIFYVDGIEVGRNVTNGSGVVVFSWKVNRVGNLKLEAVFGGTDFYLSSSNVSSMSVSKGSTFVVVPNFSSVYGDNIELSATLKHGVSPLMGGTVIFYVDGSEVGRSVTNGSGVAVFSWKVNRVGSLKLDAVFNGTGFYLGSSNVSSMSVSRGSTFVVVPNFSGVYGGNIELNATLKQNGFNLSNVTVIFYVDGIEVGRSVTNGSGVAVFGWKVNRVGSLKLDAVFGGTDFYLSSSNVSSMSVSKGSTFVVVPNFSGVYGGNIELNAILKHGVSPLMGGTVIFYVDGIEVGRSVTNGSGVAVFGWKVNRVGSLKLDAVFGGTGFYLGSSNSSLMSVSKGSTFVVVPNFSGVYGGNIELNAILKHGVSPLMGGTVIFYVDGSEVGRSVTNGSGVAVFSWKVNRVGNLKLDAVFGGTGFYLGSSNVSSMSVSKGSTFVVVPNFSGVYGGNIELNATLKQNGFNLGNVTVIFYVDGSEVGRSVTNGSGVAVFNWKVNRVGSLKLGAVFGGTGFYLGSSNASLMSVSKGSTFVVVPNFSGVYGGNIELNAILKHGVSPLMGGTVIFYVNGQDIGRNITNSNGIAILNWKADQIGSLKLQAIFNEDNFYSSSSDINSVIVNKKTSSLSVSNFNAVYGDKINLYSILKQGAYPIIGEVVVFRVNNVEVGKNLTNNNGIATLTYKSNQTGNLKLQTIFNGNNLYIGSTSNNSIEIIKKQSLIIISNFKGNYNKNIKLKAILKDNSNSSINKEFINFHVNGKYVGKNRTNSLGVAIFNYKIESTGIFKVKAEFNNGINYLNSNSESLLTVPKQTTIKLKNFSKEVEKLLYFILYYLVVDLIKIVLQYL
ncbi:Ig-like domain repeat protein [Methanobrevibacter filiformis]|uniref:Bacterial Ig-like domain protein n=1 Tax=Methanobrevibacter filiformis TaxID=55758 RepID=A0A166F895_9EURY|nr:Ig-like domain repeat protein [Methanobrevibacter filiformis]KZX17419.1 bacterial Ig-like domain protein [Methanobrevibacter filiformis]